MQEIKEFDDLDHDYLGFIWYSTQHVQMQILRVEALFLPVHLCYSITNTDSCF